MGRDTDIIVVGAGPAGSTAAKLLADRGYHVLLVDRAAFPRHKTCASWINRLAFERFGYLAPHLEELVECPFYGVSFYDSTLERSGHYRENEPCGYLSLRAKFDDGLRRIAVGAGAEFLGGSRVVDLAEEPDGIRVRLADHRVFRARVVIGADGASSRVAVAAGLRKGWQPRDYVLCANADIPFETSAIESFYGPKFPFRVYLEYKGLVGYGWVFPKRRHICIGVGGRLEDPRMIRPLFSGFLEELRNRGHIPQSLREEGTYFDIDPVGAVHHLPTLTRGRVVLIGDAAGFVSGSTGEGIYPGMVSGELAAQVIDKAMARGDVPNGLAGFNQAWRKELGEYVRRLPGGDEEGKTRRRINLIFRSPLISRIAGRVFLYGEPLSLGTIIRSICVK